ncbi:MAG: peptidoglycan-associated lipoprotein Pal [Pseudomonadota bacterium]
MKKIILTCLLAALVAGCSATPTKEQEPAAVEDRAGQGAGQAGTGTETRPLGGPGVGGDPLKDPANILSKRSIFYDYDSFLVKDEYKPIVQAHANYLRANRSAAVVLQGNADERGSREYNLALGQKRAESVRKLMELLGVGANQIEAVSFGEEKPRCTDSTEACWAENRRVDIVYRGE